MTPFRERYLILNVGHSTSTKIILPNLTYIYRSQLITLCILVLGSVKTGNEERVLICGSRPTVYY